MADRVAPGTIGVHAGHPILLRADPRVLAHRHAGPGGLVEAEQRELRVGVVADAAALVLLVAPRAGGRPLLHLGPFQPPHIAFQDGSIGLRREHRQDHGLQRHGVGFVGFLGPHPAQRPRQRRVGGRHAGVGQRQHHQRRGPSRLVAGTHRFPGAVRLLLLEEVVAGLVDRPLDVGRAQRAGRGGRHRRSGREDARQQGRGPQRMVEQSLARAGIHGWFPCRPNLPAADPRDRITFDDAAACAGDKPAASVAWFAALRVTPDTDG